AQSMLGNCYIKGQGVHKNDLEAVRWFRRAAEQGDTAGQGNLGWAYCQGEGVAKNPGGGVEWLLQAARQGDDNAQVKLGFCYYRGEGVPKDEVEAYKWWLLAAAKGNEYAKKDVAIAESRMTRYETAQGQKLARDFTPHFAVASSVDSSRPDTLAASPKGAG